jgi:hypothetical protein
MTRPAGVTAIAIVLGCVAAYLALLGTILLIFPGAIPLSLGAPLLHGLEIAGPFMFLICAAISALVSFGLLRLNNLARRAAIMIGFAGMIMLIPKVSADTAEFSPRFFLSGSMIIVRMMMIWYLWQGWTAEKFH